MLDRGSGGLESGVRSSGNTCTVWVPSVAVITTLAPSDCQESDTVRAAVSRTQSICTVDPTGPVPGERLRPWTLPFHGVPLWRLPTSTRGSVSRTR